MTTQSRTLLALSIVFVAYAIWAFATSSLIEAFYGYRCQGNYLTIQCEMPADTVEAAVNYIPLLILFVVVASLMGWRSPNAVALPFIILTALLCIAVMTWDLIARQPVIHSSKIVNDTINILGAVIAASFALLIVLCRGIAFSLSRLALAAGLSYVLTVASVMSFVELSGIVYGATELFLLYVTYAFGSFTLHLMTVCGFVRRLPIGAQESIS